MPTLRFFSLQVNYLYDLEQLDRNNQAYVLEGKIAIADTALDLSPGE